MFIGLCIVVIVEEWKTNLMSLVILFHFLCASACKTNTTQNQSHQISNTQQTENKTTDVVIQQHSRKLLMMDILMSETCWAHRKWNKIASDIKLVFLSSTIIHIIYFNRTNHYACLLQPALFISIFWSPVINKGITTTHIESTLQCLEDADCSFGLS